MAARLTALQLQTEDVYSVTVAIVGLLDDRAPTNGAGWRNLRRCCAPDTLAGYTLVTLGGFSTTPSGNEQYGRMVADRNPEEVMAIPAHQIGRLRELASVTIYAKR